MQFDSEHRIAATGFARLVRAMGNTANGIRHAFRSEAAVRQEVALIVVAIPIGFVIAPNAGWYVAMIASLLVLIVIELLNTAIEKLADHVTPDWNTRIGLVKDFGSAAVFVTVLIAGLVWLAAVGLRIGFL